MSAPKTVSTLILALGACALLSACGKQGDLERPVPKPMWGKVSQSAPGSKEENLDPASNNRPQSQAPLPGTSSPFGTPQPSPVLR